MGIYLEYVSLAEVPHMSLVQARASEKLGRRVELIEHPGGFDLEIKNRLFINMLPGERVIDICDLTLGPEHPLYEFPAYLLLCRALTELGGKQGAIELLARRRFRQRFEFEGSAPTPLEVHEQLIRLGVTGIGPPTPYEPWFELFTEAPDAQTLLLHPQPPWLHMIAGYDCGELAYGVYDILASFGAKPRPDR